MPKFGMEHLQIEYKKGNSSLNLMGARLGDLDRPRYKPDTVMGANDMAKRLKSQGGFSQQDRMIKDKQEKRTISLR